MLSLLCFGPTPVAALEGDGPTLLTDPFLQRPTADSVAVVWFTEERGQDHRLEWGERLQFGTSAQTVRLTRMFEDAGSRQAGRNRIDKRPVRRTIWRHEALASGLTPGGRVPYRVSSEIGGSRVVSRSFTLAPAPAPGQGFTVLLTSDHQLKPLTPANLEMAAKVAGRIDAVFFAGDLVNIPDRASEWFDDARGMAFFPALQGRARKPIALASRPKAAGEGSVARRDMVYAGGEIIQHAPLFPAIGNHEVMGRYDARVPLNLQFNDPKPLAVVEAAYSDRADTINPKRDPDVRARWLRDNSFNTISYDEIFSVPRSSSATERYYATRFGDLFLVSLFVTRIWRTPKTDPDRHGTFVEKQPVAPEPMERGHGRFIFDSIAKGSPQYEWLAETLSSEPARSARYRIVMLHHPIHGLGDNVLPPFSEPLHVVDRDAEGKTRGVKYFYPRGANVLLSDLKPLLEAHGVELVLNGHSHLWNRFRSSAGTSYLETSNVGNSYGCFTATSGAKRSFPRDASFAAENYDAVGDPGGLAPVMPSVFAPQLGADGQPLPCLASDDLTVFTLLDSGSGVVSSYVFDPRSPDTAPRLFDAFRLD